ncbi:MAG: retron system putative HNH endonuclease [Cetobacterium sp.]
MLKVNKTPEPEFFQEFKRKNKLSNWDEYNSYPELKQALREHMLLEEQDLCCPYCEIQIEVENSEIEHVKPQDYLTYDIKTGQVIPKEISGEKYEKAKETIEILNLNESRLCNMRKTIILQTIKNLDFLEYIDGFSSLKFFLKGTK